MLWLLSRARALFPSMPPTSPCKPLPPPSLSFSSGSSSDPTTTTNHHPQHRHPSPQGLRLEALRTQCCAERQESWVLLTCSLTLGRPCLCFWILCLSAVDPPSSNPLILAGSALGCVALRGGTEWHTWEKRWPSVWLRLLLCSAVPLPHSRGQKELSGLGDGRWECGPGEALRIGRRPPRS